MDLNSSFPENSTFDSTPLAVNPYTEAMSLIAYKIGEIFFIFK